MASVSMAFVGSDMDNKILDAILGAIPQPIIAIDASERRYRNLFVSGMIHKIVNNIDEIIPAIEAMQA